MECVDTLFDDFSVDELLDLSNADGILGEETPTEEDEQLREKHTSFSDQTHVSSTEGFFPVTGCDLDFPVDELAELEWLSKFIEDSFSEPNLSSDCPVKPNSLSVNHDSPTVESVATKKPFFRTTVPAKPRSKRHRAGGRVWYIEYPSGNDTSASSSSSSSSGPLKSSLCGGVASSQTPEPARGKRKRKPFGSGGGRGAHQPRRCSHCGVQKTPQWRMGPSGAKTLCNACGVRFKSGRLLPEYRPASSPTFSSELHSNSHRKVMELRRKKEVF